MPPDKNQVNFYGRTETMLFSTSTQKPSTFRPRRENQVNSDPYTEVKSISIPISKPS